MRITDGLGVGVSTGVGKSAVGRIRVDVGKGVLLGVGGGSGSGSGVTDPHATSKTIIAQAGKRRRVFMIASLPWAPGIHNVHCTSA